MPRGYGKGGKAPPSNRPTVRGKGYGKGFRISSKGPPNVPPRIDSVGAKLAYGAKHGGKQINLGPDAITQKEVNHVRHQLYQLNAYQLFKDMPLKESHRIIKEYIATGKGDPRFNVAWNALKDYKAQNGHSVSTSEDEYRPPPKEVMYYKSSSPSPPPRRGKIVLKGPPARAANNDTANIERMSVARDPYYRPNRREKRHPFQDRMGYHKGTNYSAGSYDTTDVNQRRAIAEKWVDIVANMSTDKVKLPKGIDKDEAIKLIKNGLIVGQFNDKVKKYFARVKTQANKDGTPFPRGINTSKMIHQHSAPTGTYDTSDEEHRNEIAEKWSDIVKNTSTDKVKLPVGLTKEQAAKLIKDGLAKGKLPQEVKVYLSKIRANANKEGIEVPRGINVSALIKAPMKKTEAQKKNEQEKKNETARRTNVPKGYMGARKAIEIDSTSSSPELSSETSANTSSSESPYVNSKIAAIENEPQNKTQILPMQVELQMYKPVDKNGNPIDADKWVKEHPASSSTSSDEQAKPISVSSSTITTSTSSDEPHRVNNRRIYVSSSSSPSTSELEELSRNLGPPPPIPKNPVLDEEPPQWVLYPKSVEQQKEARKYWTDRGMTPPVYGIKGGAPQYTIPQVSNNTSTQIPDDNFNYLSMARHQLQLAAKLRELRKKKQKEKNKADPKKAEKAFKQEQDAKKADVINALATQAILAKQQENQKTNTTPIVQQNNATGEATKMIDAPMSDIMSGPQKFLANVFGRDTTARQIDVLNQQDYNQRNVIGSLPYQKKFDPTNVDRQLTPYEKGVNKFLSDDTSMIKYNPYVNQTQTNWAGINAAGQAIGATVAPSAPIAGATISAASAVLTSIAQALQDSSNAKQARAEEDRNSVKTEPKRYAYDPDTGEKYETYEYKKWALDHKFDLETKDLKATSLKMAEKKDEYAVNKDEIDKEEAEREEKAATTPEKVAQKETANITAQLGLQDAQIAKLTQGDKNATMIANAKVSKANAEREERRINVTDQITESTDRQNIKTTQFQEQTQDQRQEIEKNHLKAQGIDSKIAVKEAEKREENHEKKQGIDQKNFEASDVSASHNLAAAQFAHETQESQQAIARKRVQDEFEGTILQNAHDRLLAKAKGRQEKRNDYARFLKNFQDFKGAMAMYEAMKELDEKNSVNKLKKMKNKEKERKKMKEEFEKRHLETLEAIKRNAILAGMDEYRDPNSGKWVKNGKVDTQAVLDSGGSVEVANLLQERLNRLSWLGVEQQSQKPVFKQSLGNDFNIAANGIDRNMYRKSARQKLQNIMNFVEKPDQMRDAVDWERTRKVARPTDSDIEIAADYTFTPASFPEYFDSKLAEAKKAKGWKDIFKRGATITGAALATYLATKGGISKDAMTDLIRLFPGLEGMADEVQKQNAKKEAKKTEAFNATQRSRAQYLNETGLLKDEYRPKEQIGAYFEATKNPDIRPVTDLDKFMNDELGFVPSAYATDDKISDLSWRKILAKNLDGEGKFNEDITKKSGMINAREAAARVNLIMDLVGETAEQNGETFTNTDLDRKIESMLFLPKKDFNSNVEAGIKRLKGNKLNKLAVGFIKEGVELHKDMTLLKEHDRKAWDRAWEEQRKANGSKAREASIKRMIIMMRDKYNLIDPPDTKNPDSFAKSYGENSGSDKLRNNTLASIAARIHTIGVPTVEDFDEFMTNYGKKIIGNTGTWEALSKNGGAEAFEERGNLVVDAYDLFAQGYNKTLSKDTSFNERASGSGDAGLQDTFDLAKAQNEVLNNLKKVHVGKKNDEQPIQGPEEWPFESIMGMAKKIMNKHNNNAIRMFKTMKEHHVLGYFNHENADEIERAIADKNSNWIPIIQSLTHDRKAFHKLANNPGVQSVLKSLNPDGRAIDRDLFLRVATHRIRKDPNYKFMLEALKKNDAPTIETYKPILNKFLRIPQFTGEYKKIGLYHKIVDFKQDHKDVRNTATAGSMNYVSEDIHDINSMLPESQKLKPITYDEDAKLPPPEYVVNQKQVWKARQDLIQTVATGNVNDDSTHSEDIKTEHGAPPVVDNKKTRKVSFVKATEEPSEEMSATTFGSFSMSPIKNNPTFKKLNHDLAHVNDDDSIYDVDAGSPMKSTRHFVSGDIDYSDIASDYSSDDDV